MAGANQPPPHLPFRKVYTGVAIWFPPGMKIIAQVVVLMRLAFSGYAASIQGDITLPYSITDTNITIQTKEFGDAVKASWRCRVGDFYGWETIFAHVTITNTGSKRMWGQCSVAFYDQDKNLVGTATQTFIARRGLRPRTRKLGVCRIILPKDRYREVVSYQAVVTEIASPPQKKKEAILLEDP
jgi:hypothetical protein